MNSRQTSTGWLGRARSALRRGPGSALGTEPAPPSVTPQAVVWGYRLFLDRDPENIEVVQEKASLHASIQALRDEFLHSEEFVRKYGGSLSGNEPRMQIEEVLSESDLQALFAHIQKVWQQLGETEPHWSVLTSGKFLQANIADHRDAFYGSGKPDVGRLYGTLERNGIDHSRFRSCLDYGCGLGRVTRWLAERFDEVHGYDISRPHLQAAGEYLEGQGVQNVQLHHLTRVQDLEALPRVDLVYSIIVLQHNPPPVMAYAIRQLVRALNPGGVAYFQVPTYLFGYGFSLAQYLYGGAAKNEMEVHALPQSTIFRILREEGAEPVEVIQDGWTGLWHRAVSNTFLVRKAQA